VYYLAPVIFIAFIFLIDPNVSDYLYLQLIASPVLWIRTQLFKYTLLWGLKWQTYRIKRGHVSRKYVKMAEEIRSEIDKKP
jgi:hypothetical protein